MHTSTPLHKASLPREEDLCQMRVIHLDRVQQAKQLELQDSELLKLSSLYKALADPTRLKIVMALMPQEMCVCDLAAFIHLSESAVSHQLRYLRELSLVKKRREGQVIYYSLNDEHVVELLRIGLTHSRE